MSESPIPDDVRRFIQHCIPSVPFLEALLLLRDTPQQAWDSAQLASRLYLGTTAAAKLLLRLQRADIIAADGACYRYRPGTPELADILDRLAQVYASHLVEVSTLIHSKPHRKAQLFADAFIWRKDE
jgi:DNA-binding IclR family transcriptional regulator